LPEAGVGRRSVADVLSRAAAVLADAGSDTPRLDAELLLASSLDVDRARLVVDAHAEVPEDVFARFCQLVARREAHEPVAYILGRRDSGGSRSRSIGAC